MSTLNNKLGNLVSSLPPPKKKQLTKAIFHVLLKFNLIENVYDGSVLAAIGARNRQFSLCDLNVSIVVVIADRS